MAKPKINTALENFVTDLMKTANDAKTPLEDKLKILDRALKLEVLKLKVKAGTMGSAFDEGSEDDE